LIIIREYLSLGRKLIISINIDPWDPWGPGGPGDYKGILTRRWFRVRKGVNKKLKERQWI